MCQSDEPNGVVELRGAIVMRSKTVKMALEIVTGALVATKVTTHVHIAAACVLQTVRPRLC